MIGEKTYNAGLPEYFSSDLTYWIFHTRTVCYGGEEQESWKFYCLFGINAKNKEIELAIFSIGRIFSAGQKTMCSLCVG